MIQLLFTGLLVNSMDMEADRFESICIGVTSTCNLPLLPYSYISHGESFVKKTTFYSWLKNKVRLYYQRNTSAKSGCLSLIYGVMLILSPVFFFVLITLALELAERVRYIQQMKTVCTLYNGSHPVWIKLY
ncbi:hypothetical protein SRABI133_00869 [Peribacillus simplex]|uniref:Uncharacterized protein n=1 Tax=Peribacillus simplex TaxID=1478 RepID=A0A9W4KQ44_9BACI|nr:hypothetical protein SRABI133_00869 [Peribacillus simplex]